MTPELDDVEVKILAALQENPRISVTELSNRVNVSRPTINKLLASMTKSEKILLNSGLNAKAHKFRLANIGINVQSLEARANVIQIIEKCTKVLNIYRTTDQANLLLTVCGKDEQSLTSTINCIGDIPDVHIQYSRPLGIPMMNLAVPIHLGDNSVTPCGRSCYECDSYKNEWCSGCYTVSM